MIKKKVVLVTAILAMILLTACGAEPGSPTAEEVVVPSDTPEPPTDTPEPTATDTPTETPTETLLPTNTPTATLDLAATAAFEATQAAEAVLAVVGDILAGIDISTDTGHLAWANTEPIVVPPLSGPGLVMVDIADGVVYSTYVLHTTLTWETVTGLAGCGIVFHSDSIVGLGKQYRFNLIGLSGLPAWDVELYDFGTFQSNTTGGIKYNSAINHDFGGVNELLVVIREGLATFYANGIRLSNVIINSRSEGRLGYFAFVESGEATCSFADNWIWVLEG